MNKILSCLLIVACLWFLYSSVVLAETQFYDGPDSVSTSSTQVTTLKDPLGLDGDIAKVGKNLVKGALGITGVLALIAFVWGGIEWMTSGGKEQRISQGKSMMIWAVVGMVVIFGSYAIINLVFRILGG